MPRIERTIFISYRRVDIAWAIAVFQDLTHNGYDVFFDYSGIASGDFERVILANIRARAHFLVLLTPLALERCNETTDLFRREIEVALATQRNVVPLMLDGFDFKNHLASGPGRMVDALRRYNGLPVHAAYFEEAMVRLRKKYLNVPLETVLHSVTPFAEQATREQQQAAVQGAATVPLPIAANSSVVPAATGRRWRMPDLWRVTRKSATANRGTGLSNSDIAAEAPSRPILRRRWVRVVLIAVPILAIILASIDNWPQYRLQAAFGDAHAMNLLAYLYDVGTGGVSKDEAKRDYWRRRAAEGGNVDAMSELAMMLYHDGCCGLSKEESQVQAESWYRKAANLGDRNSMYWLGWMYEHTEGGLPKDDTQALAWYRKSAAAGEDWARLRIGEAYEQGELGLPKNDDEAVRWYQLAAAGAVRNDFATYRLGQMYEQGRGGLPKDVEKAVELYRKAEVMNNDARDALKRLGRE
jgi:TPR repeat protein